MRIYVTIIFTINILYAEGQYKFKLREHAVTMALVFTSGMADGLNQYINYHYDGTNQFWQPDISWTNKYRGHNPNEGPAFFLSTGPLVFLTDGHHLTRFVDRACMVGGLANQAAISLKMGQKGLYKGKKWWMWALDGSIYWLTNRIGFNIAYNYIKIK